jgi:tRNA (guanine-N7-)-methyltransferase
MSQIAQHVTNTRQIQNPTYYVSAINGEFAEYTYDEERAAALRGEWRFRSFAKSSMTDRVNSPLDLEIGTGYGLFFSHHAKSNPTRFCIGLEIKFKPLILAARRLQKNASTNAVLIRYHAKFVENLFAPGELNNIYIHHPDPWTKRRKHKHRLLQATYIERLYDLQKPGSFIDFKTDSKDYFDWAVEQFKKTKYSFTRHTEDLHRSEWSGENFTTQFEKIFVSKGQPIYYLRASL